MKKIVLGMIILVSVSSLASCKVNLNKHLFNEIKSAGKFDVDNVYVNKKNNQ